MADDHTLMLEALRNLLEPEFDVVGLATDGWTLLRKAEELTPDLILLDTSISRLNGLDAGRKLRSILPSAKLVYLTMQRSESCYRGLANRGTWLCPQVLFGGRPS